jgi:pyruvyl transferase EpsO
MPENLLRVTGMGSLHPSVARSFDAMSWLNLKAAKRILAPGRTVITDRLHAAVLAQLMGRDVIAVDNANHKISRIHEAYMGRIGNVRMAASFNEAIHCATR